MALNFKNTGIFLYNVDQRKTELNNRIILDYRLERFLKSGLTL